MSNGFPYEMLQEGAGGVIGFIKKPDYESNLYRLQEFPIIHDNRSYSGILTNALPPIHIDILALNTYTMEGDEGGYILIEEPFLMTSETRYRAEKWIEWANAHPTDVVGAHQFLAYAKEVSDEIDVRKTMYKNVGKIFWGSADNLIVCGAPVQHCTTITYDKGAYYCGECGTKLSDEDPEDAGNYCKNCGGHIIGFRSF